MEQFSHGQFSSMKRWSLQDKKADGVTVINFMQILAELKLTRRESDPELWGMSGPQHIIRGQQYKRNVVSNALYLWERAYLKESVQRFETGSFWSYNRDRDRRPGCLKPRIWLFQKELYFLWMIILLTRWKLCILTDLKLFLAEWTDSQGGFSFL